MVFTIKNPPELVACAFSPGLDDIIADVRFSSR